MSKKFLLIVFGLMGLAFGYYAFLGGFNKPEIIITASPSRYVAGQYYEGPADDPAFGEYFKKAGRLHEAKTLPGNLANIYYNSPEEKSDSIKAFIGILVPDSSVSLPAGYELRVWKGGSKVVQATTRAHYLLAPNKLYPALFDYLKDKHLKTSAQYLEEFPAKDQARVKAVLVD